MSREDTADNSSRERHRAVSRRIDGYRVPADYRERSRASVARFHGNGWDTRIGRTVVVKGWRDYYRFAVLAISGVLTSAGVSQIVEAVTR